MREITNQEFKGDTIEVGHIGAPKGAKPESLSLAFQLAETRKKVDRALAKRRVTRHRDRVEKVYIHIGPDYPVCNTSEKCLFRGFP